MKYEVGRLDSAVKITTENSKFGLEMVDFNVRRSFLFGDRLCDILRRVLG